ncbi:hypothetical protein BMT55_15650 [Listeria newyorkensis]|uniref:Uncharacterized protein n=1 Tax=Listeria newyorkensis TaxID=1497681 RepID=A0ABX4XJ35_9LIST|nr:hypothetical protein [Listeria newyorkensis]KGL45704.1 hypothetical protein EP58_03155 [Listeria newyorkensis]PNP88197.1 hypothetical protein BMT55_15650 [Listeria newyorkensis]SQC55364.1 Uncharacterised protein [Listeria newyorkensis]
MNFDKKLEKAILEDLEARKARARFYDTPEEHASVAELEKELTFFKAGFVKRVPAEWIARYCEEDAE